MLCSILLVLSHMLGYREQKLLGRSRKSLFFLKSNFVGSEKFQASAHVCRNKKFCSVKSRFPVHLPSCKFWTILALYRLFLWRFQWNVQIIICSCPCTDLPSFVDNISKHKICHFWQQLDICETSFFITEWIALQLKILTDTNIRFKKKKNFFTIDPVVFAPGT
jgi:hypothetical protein